MRKNLEMMKVLLKMTKKNLKAWGKNENEVVICSGMRLRRK
jgi:hypothetical protein